MAFMSAQEMNKKEEHKKQLEKTPQQLTQTVYPFWLAVGQSAQVTFLDGEIIEFDGGNKGFDTVYALQHTVNLGTQWLSFVCPKNHHGECPACAVGQKGSYVCFFTVIDHTPYQSKKDPSLVYQHVKKLFIATSGTREELFVRAKKFNESLKYLFVDIERSHKDKAPRVGDVFTPMGKKTLKELKTLCGKDVDLKPLNYETDVFLYTPQQLLDLGVGYGKGQVQNTTSPMSANTKNIQSLTKSSNDDVEEAELDW